MLEFLTVDLPLVLIGYCLIVFLISHFTASVGVVKPEGSGLSGAADSNTETWSVGHEPQDLTLLDEGDTALFDPVAMFEMDEEEFETEESPDLSPVPSDPVLRRHYRTHLKMMVEALHPEPQDAVLKRHHGQWLETLLDALMTRPEAVEELSASYEAREIMLEGVEENSSCEVLSHVPTDAVLKRHFLSHLQMMLETLWPVPNDAVLRRHHEQLLGTQLLSVLESREALNDLQSSFESRPVMIEASE